MPSECLVKLYNAFIQPYIDYCILIWGVTSSTNRIRVQRFQNRCACIICNNFDNDVTGLSLVRMLGWLNVAQRHDFMLGILVHKCLYGLVPHYFSDNLTQLRDMEQRETCSSEQHLLYVPFAKTS